MPAAAAHDATVTITGRRLCGASADCASAAGQVQIGLDAPIVRANVTAYTDTHADIVIPEVAPAGVTKIVVTVNERASNSIDFEVLP
jgi:hypothetical protein